MSDNTRSILIIEDDAGLLDLLSEIVANCGYIPVNATSSQEAMNWLQVNTPFLIILDYGLPDMTGKEFITALRDFNSVVPPFVVSTGQGDERIAVEMMKLGARDYIIKDINFLEMMPIVIQKVAKIIDNELQIECMLQTLKTNEERQRAMITNISDVIAIVDREGYIRYKSPNSEVIFGWKPEDIIGQNTYSNVHPLDSALVKEKFIEALKNENKSIQIEFRYKCKNGIFKWIELTAINQINNPSINGILVNYHDISQRKQTEKDLIDAKERAEESDRLKTAFLQNMSHEIRTPMNAIVGFSSLLSDQFNNKQKLVEYAEIISQRSNDLLAIINDILDIAKIESGQVTVNATDFDINRLFNELSLFFSEQRISLHKQDIHFSCTASALPNNGHVRLDGIKLKQILINLIGNAFKFTDFGNIECSCQAYGTGELLFYVSDTGQGIPEDMHKAVFERFTQLNTPINKLVSGTGLGLSIVEGLVKLMGGRIWLVSAPGAGSTFYFTLPYNKSTLPAQVTSNTNNYIRYNFIGKTILIVEDDYYNAEYLKEILVSTGARLLHTMFGNSALDITRENQIDLVLMDIRLPDSNGYDVTKILLQKYPELMVIAQTAYASIDEKSKALKSGFVDFISKPTEKAALLSLIDKYLRTKHAEWA